MIATVPAVIVLLTLVHLVACGQSSYAAPASSSPDPPPAGGHVDTLYSCTSVHAIPRRSVLRLPWELLHTKRRCRAVTGQATLERVHAMRERTLVLRFVVTAKAPPRTPPDNHNATASTVYKVLAIGWGSEP